jgi:hypothetical protein
MMASPEEIANKKIELDAACQAELDALALEYPESSQGDENYDDPVPINGWSGAMGSLPPRNARGQFLPVTGKHTKQARLQRWAEQDERERLLAQEEWEDQDHQSLFDFDAGSQSPPPDLPSVFAAGVGIPKATMVDASTETDHPVLCSNCSSQVEERTEDVWDDSIDALFGDSALDAMEAETAHSHGSIDHISAGSHPGFHAYGHQRQPVDGDQNDDGLLEIDHQAAVFSGLGAGLALEHTSTSSTFY